ncbi:FOG: EAL domain [Zymobacter palmae]|uniref:FOG: EAL domain n=1 Tax=Zymobacter palmae TaxID=33074 RepID=A0A348HDU0_9GAMM|nr:FOG: EAL domain [Zymobacter palmae]
MIEQHPAGVHCGGLADEAMPIAVGKVPHMAIERYAQGHIAHYLLCPPVDIVGVDGNLVGHDLRIVTAFALHHDLATVDGNGVGRITTMAFRQIQKDERIGILAASARVATEQYLGIFIGRNPPLDLNAPLSGIKHVFADVPTGSLRRGRQQ